jgi:hypothetical protein
MVPVHLQAHLCHRHQEPCDPGQCPAYWYPPYQLHIACVQMQVEHRTLPDSETVFKCDTHMKVQNHVKYNNYLTIVLN